MSTSSAVIDSGNEKIVYIALKPCCDSSHGMLRVFVHISMCQGM